MINDMGILVHEVAPDADSLLLASTKNSADDDAAEEAAATLVTVDSEFGRTTDPVRMYMREMGTVELLTREGEIVIAKRIEDGLNQVIVALASFPESTATLLRAFERVEAGDMRLNDLISGFVDPNADAEAAPLEVALAPPPDDDSINGDDMMPMPMVDTGPDQEARNFRGNGKPPTAALEKGNGNQARIEKLRAQRTAVCDTQAGSAHRGNTDGESAASTVYALTSAPSWFICIKMPICRARISYLLPDNETNLHWVDRQIEDNHKYPRSWRSIAMKSCAYRTS
jgi:RNA polymerase primary sigma factor